MAKPRYFFCTGESMREILGEMCTDRNRRIQDAENWLRQCEADHKNNGSPPSYWRSIKIFRVTIEEMDRPKR